MAGLIALKEPIVNLLFQRGEFTYAATQGTAEALLFYSIGIWSIVGVRVITATFYSMQDTKTPVKIAAVGVASNLLLSLILMGPLRHSGLALANSLASGINFLILFLSLRKKLHSIEWKKIAYPSFRSSFHLASWDWRAGLCCAVNSGNKWLGGNKGRLSLRDNDLLHPYLCHSKQPFEK